MKIAHKIVQVPEMKFLLRPFIHNVKRNNQNIHEIFQEKSHVYFQSLIRFCHKTISFAAYLPIYYWGRFVKKISKAFGYNNHQCLIQELCIQIKIYTRKIGIYVYPKI